MISSISFRQYIHLLARIYARTRTHKHSCTRTHTPGGDYRQPGPAARRALPPRPCNAAPPLRPRPLRSSRRPPGPRPEPVFSQQRQRHRRVSRQPPLHLRSPGTKRRRRRQSPCHSAATARVYSKSRRRRRRPSAWQQSGHLGVTAGLAFSHRVRAFQCAGRKAPPSPQRAVRVVGRRGLSGPTPLPRRAGGMPGARAGGVRIGRSAAFLRPDGQRRLLHRRSRRRRDNPCKRKQIRVEGPSLYWTGSISPLRCFGHGNESALSNRHAAAPSHCRNSAGRRRRRSSEIDGRVSAVAGSGSPPHALRGLGHQPPALKMAGTGGPRPGPGRSAPPHAKRWSRCWRWLRIAAGSGSYCWRRGCSSRGKAAGACGSVEQGQRTGRGFGSWRRSGAEGCEPCRNERELSPVPRPFVQGAHEEGWCRYICGGAVGCK